MTSSTAPLNQRQQRIRQAVQAANARPGITTPTPVWSPIHRTTQDVLALVADLGHPSVDYEWTRFMQGLDQAADHDEIVDPNVLRPLLRGQVAPNRIGAFTSRSVSQRILVATGDWVVSDDLDGRNSGKPAKVYRLSRTVLHGHANSVLVQVQALTAAAS